LDVISLRLIEAETIEREEYENIIKAHGIPLKKKAEGNLVDTGSVVVV
jgi:hypothetical protein